MAVTTVDEAVRWDGKRVIKISYPLIALKVGTVQLVCDSVAEARQIVDLLREIMTVIDRKLSADREAELEKREEAVEGLKMDLRDERKLLERERAEFEEERNRK